MGGTNTSVVTGLIKWLAIVAVTCTDAADLPSAARIVIRKYHYQSYAPTAIPLPLPFPASTLHPSLKQRKNFKSKLALIPDQNDDNDQFSTIIDTKSSSSSDPITQQNFNQNANSVPFDSQSSSDNNVGSNHDQWNAQSQSVPPMMNNDDERESKHHSIVNRASTRLNKLFNGFRNFFKKKNSGKKSRDDSDDQANQVSGDQTQTRAPGRFGRLVSRVRQFFNKKLSRKKSFDADNDQTNRPSATHPNINQVVPLDVPIYPRSSQVSILDLDKPIGLKNTGNSCYQNSVIQMLHFTEDFKQQFVIQNTDDTTDLGNMKRKLIDVFLDLGRQTEHTRTFSSKTEDLKASLKAINPPGIDFSSSSQHCASEFLGRVIDDTVIANLQDMFAIQMQSTLSIAEIGFDDSSTLDPPASTLELPVQRKDTAVINDVQGLIDEYQEPEADMEMLELNGILRTKTVQIIGTGKFLLIRLNRFQFDGRLKEIIKLMNSVHINEEITVNNRKYRLYAAVVHSGCTANYGHYWTIARRSTHAEKGTDQWWKLNDFHVTSSSLNDLQSLRESDTPYILSYVQVDH